MAKRYLVLSSLLVLGAAPAWAHPVDGAHAHALVAGLTHPVLGLDHLLFMVAIGIWAAMQGRRQLLLVPLSFVAGMAGGLFSGFGVEFAASVELAIALSVAALGLMLALAARLPVLLSMSLAACAGLAHGAAHAVETPLPDFTGFAAGALATTLVLHVVGASAGLASARSARPLLRGAGAAMMLFGAALGLGFA